MQTERARLVELPEDDRRLCEIMEGYEDLDTLEAVIAMMKELALAFHPQDKLGAFNQLYLDVTEEVANWSREQKWNDDRWLRQLVIEFAKLYFGGIKKSMEGAADAPLSWQVVADRKVRFDPRRLAFQFALAGINAHINYDLARAVVEADKALDVKTLPGSPAHQDYVRIAEILRKVEIESLKKLGVGRLKQLNSFADGMDEKVLLGVIRIGREIAFVRAGVHDWPGLGSVANGPVDRLVGDFGRGLLHAGLAEWIRDGDAQLR